MNVFTLLLLIMAAFIYIVIFISKILAKVVTTFAEKAAFIMTVAAIGYALWDTYSETPLEKLTEAAGSVYTHILRGDCNRARISAVTLHGFTKLNPALIELDPQIRDIYYGTFAAIKECEAAQ